MFAVEVYAAVRHFVFVEGNSRREAARIFGLRRETILKMCRFSLPPGYTRTQPVPKPKLGPLPTGRASGAERVCKDVLLAGVERLRNEQHRLMKKNQRSL